MILRLQALLGRNRSFPSRERVFFSPIFLYRQGSPWCHDSVLFSVVTMSRQRFPCRDQDGRGKRSRLRQELSQGQEFYVATKYYYVATELPSQEFSVVTEFFSVTTEYGQMKRFCVATEQFYVTT